MRHGAAEKYVVESSRKNIYQSRMERNGTDENTLSIFPTQIAAWKWKCTNAKEGGALVGVDGGFGGQN